MDTREQMRRALEEIEKPTKALMESFRNVLPAGFAQGKMISEMAAIGQREMALANSIARHTAEMEKLARPFALDKVAEMERLTRSLAWDKHAEMEELTRTLQIDAAAIDRLTRPFGLNKAEFASLTNPFSSQVDEIKKLQDSIFGFDKASKIGDIEEMLGGSRKRAEEMFRSFTTSTIADALNKFEWKDLSATIASAAEATNQTDIQAAVKLALAESQSEKSDTSSALGGFLQAFMMASGAEGFGKLVVWYFVFELVKTILISASVSTTDYYVKDYLSKAAQAEDRRALAKEVAKEIGKLGLAREYVSVRRYAIKPQEVHMNPRANSPVIGSVRGGELVEVIRVDRDWTHIVFRDSKGKEFVGWAYTRYLKALPSRGAAEE
ncbi:MULTISPECIES: SH3 domain-containing protein [unclassified Variovorax]|uniref:SH3 domain-containing protein n=1 Tax=unclassified Variovorax TaxID=663243 RepID=UPI000A5F68F8|nr:MULTISPECIES: SH3 domain-containing protein [unclassified Variovorax]PNG45929.1 hypothetical protein CHC06_07907 [Variovorax sp. B2]PNG46185.1 hypothetical protein CHC07_07933 [Variovorax sp. B4]VTV19285.1 hypothetical protein WDL1P3_00207 [Variovorax sp. WDL1]